MPWPKTLRVGQKSQPQQPPERENKAPATTQTTSTHHFKETTKIKPQKSNSDYAQAVIDDSGLPPVPSKSGHYVPQTRSQRALEHQRASEAPVRDDRCPFESSGIQFIDEEQEEASCHQGTNTTSVGQHNEPWNQLEEGDQAQQGLARDHSNSKARPANTNLSDAKAKDASRLIDEKPFSTRSYLQVDVGNGFNVAEGASPETDVSAPSPDRQDSREYYPEDGLRQSDDPKLGTAHSDSLDRDEARHDHSLKLHIRSIPRRLFNGGNQQQGSGKPTQLSNDGSDQVPQAEEMQKLQVDHAIPMKAPQELHQAQIATLETRYRKSIENAQTEKDNLVRAHQNAMQEWSDEKLRLRQFVVDSEHSVKALRSDLKSAQDHSTSLWKELDSKKEQLSTAQQALEKVKIDYSNLSKELRSTQEEAERLKQSIEDSVHQNNELTQTLTKERKKLTKAERVQVDERSQHAEVITALHQKLKLLVDDSNAQVLSLTKTQSQETDQLKHTHKVEMSRAFEEHNNEIRFYQQQSETLKTEVKKKLQDLSLTYDQQIAQLINTHDRAEAQLKADLTQVTADEGKKRQSMKDSFDKQWNQARQGHEQALSRMEEDMAQAIENEELKLWELKEAYAAEQAQKDSKYARGTRQLRDDVQRLNAALLTRDDQMYEGELFTTSGLPNKPDEQIRAKFSEIEQMVDSLGRLQWKQEPAVWTSEVLRSIRGNRTDRVLKKAIVQDLVWCLLFKHVFCSPFRVFGAEGRLLEQEWQTKCGQGMLRHTSPNYTKRC